MAELEGEVVQLVNTEAEYEQVGDDPAQFTGWQDIEKDQREIAAAGQELSANELSNLGSALQTKTGADHIAVGVQGLIGAVTGNEAENQGVHKANATGEFFEAHADTLTALRAVAGEAASQGGYGWVNLARGGELTEGGRMVISEEAKDDVINVANVEGEPDTLEITTGNTPDTRKSFFVNFSEGKVSIDEGDGEIRDATTTEIAEVQDSIAKIEQWDAEGALATTNFAPDVGRFIQDEENKSLFK